MHRARLAHGCKSSSRRGRDANSDRASLSSGALFFALICGPSVKIRLLTALRMRDSLRCSVRVVFLKKQAKKISKEVIITMPHTFTVPGNLELQRRLLRAEGRGAKHLDREKHAVLTALGDRGTPQVVAALFARTHGRFIGDFVLRNIDGLSQREAKSVVSELAEEYTAAQRRSVSTKELLKLADAEARHSIIQRAVETRQNGNGHTR